MIHDTLRPLRSSSAKINNTQDKENEHRMSTHECKEETKAVKAERNVSPATIEQQDSVKKETAEAADSPEEKKCRPVKKRRRVNGSKVCQVCGGKAQAHYFGALACTTCKAFFRRNGNKQEFKKCVYRGGCEISFQSRRFCSPCRLEKCFEVGMQADLIMDEEERKELMRKVKENRNRRKSQNRDKEFNSLSNDSSKSMASTMGVDLSTSQEVTQGQEIFRSLESSAGMTVMRQLDTTPSAERDSTSGIQVDPSTPASASARRKKILTIQGAAVCRQSSPVLSGGEGPGFTRVLPHPQTQSKEAKLTAQMSDPCYPGDLSIPPTPPTPITPCVLQPPDMWQRHSSTLSLSPVLPTSTAQSTPLTECVLSPLSVPPTSPAETASMAESLPSPSPALVTQAQVLNSFKHVPQHTLPSDPHMYWQLSPDERQLLTGLSSLYQDTLLSILHTPVPTHLARSECVTPEAYLKEREHEAHNAIMFAKRLEDFRHLHTDVQIALLKASTDQVLGIRSCALFITEKNAWLTRLGYVTLEHTTRVIPNHPYKDLSVNFFRSLKSLVKNDNKIYALLHCLVLFDPSDERIINRQQINMIRDKYVILLRHYLQSLYSYSHSEKYLMALQENLIFYRSLRREAKPLFKKFFPNIPSKLLVELMDLD